MSTLYNVHTMPNVQYSYIFKNRTPKTWNFLLNIFLYSYTFCYWTNELLLSMLYLQIFRLSCGEKWYRPAANLEAFQAWTNTLTCIKHSRKSSTRYKYQSWARDNTMPRQRAQKVVSYFIIAWFLAATQRPYYFSNVVLFLKLYYIIAMSRG